MTKYDVLIKRLEARHHHGLRYSVKVWWDKENDRGDINWAYTLWGARRLAKKMIKKHEAPKPVEKVIEEYKL